MNSGIMYEARLQFLRENPYLCDPVTSPNASSFVRPTGPVITDSRGENITLTTPIVLLASRGVCPFLKKAQVAQDLDPSVQYLIVFNFNPTGGSSSEDLIVPMYSEYGDSRLVLLSVTHRTGQALKRYLASQPANVLELGGPIITFDDTPPAGLLSVDDLRDVLLSALGMFFLLISFSGCVLMAAGAHGVLRSDGNGGIRIVLGPGIAAVGTGPNGGGADGRGIGTIMTNRSGLLTLQQVQRLRESVSRHSNSNCSDASSDTLTPHPPSLSEDAYGSSHCCAVCLDEFDEGSEILTLPVCGHEFHADCITPWLTERQAKCPLCKNDVLEHVLQMDAKSDGSGPTGVGGSTESYLAPAANRSVWTGLWRRSQWTLVANGALQGGDGDGDDNADDANLAPAQVELPPRGRGQRLGDD
jgi:hypothetical protein